MSTDIPEVLLNAIFAQDEQTDELHRMLLGWEKRAKAAEATLEKARAVLAEHQDLVLHATASPNDDPMRILIVALADALGGAGDE